MRRLAKGSALALCLALALPATAANSRTTPDRRKPAFVHGSTWSVQYCETYSQLNRWFLNPKIGLFLRPLDYMGAGAWSVFGLPHHMPYGLYSATELRLPLLFNLGIGFYGEIRIAPDVFDSGDRVIRPAERNLGYTGGAYLYNIRKQRILGALYSVDGYRAGLLDEAMRNVHTSDGSSLASLGLALHVYGGTTRDHFVEFRVNQKVSLGDIPANDSASLTLGTYNAQAIRSESRKRWVSLGFGLQVQARTQYSLFSVDDYYLIYRPYLNVGF